MPIFSGTIAGGVASTAYNNPVKIKSFNVSNKTGGAITVNVSVLEGSTNVLISPYNHPLAANAIYESEREILIPVGSVVYVLTSGSADYFFTFEEVL